MSIDRPGPALPAHQPDDTEFVPRRVDHPDAAALLRAFYDEQVDRYGFAESVDLDADAYDAPNGIFVVIYQHGEPVGCGACRWFDHADGTVEIKKIYLASKARGYGVGRTLLSWLEDQALAWGARYAILETGVRNTAALGLFTSNGYEPMTRYVPGRDPSINRAFAKALTSTARPSTEDVRHATAR